MATPVEVLLFGDTCHAWRLKPIATSFYIRIVLFNCIQKPAEVAKIIELDVIKKNSIFKCRIIQSEKGFGVGDGHNLSNELMKLNYRGIVYAVLNPLISSSFFQNCDLAVGFFFLFSSQRLEI